MLGRGTLMINGAVDPTEGIDDVDRDHTNNGFPISSRA
jgi:hypothetical protein